MQGPDYLQKVILLATSPGPGGAKSVLAAAMTSMPFFGANIIGSLSIPSFGENFDLETSKLKNVELNEKLLEITKQL